MHSSAALEAICYGKPVILIGRNAGLSINPLDGIDERMWRVVYDARELSAAIKDWSPDHPLPLAQRIELGKEIRDQYFEAVNDTSMKQFLPSSESSA